MDEAVVPQRFCDDFLLMQKNLECVEQVIHNLGTLPSKNPGTNQDQFKILSENADLCYAILNWTNQQEENLSRTADEWQQIMDVRETASHLLSALEKSCILVDIPNRLFCVDDKKPKTVDIKFSSFIGTIKNMIQASLVDSNLDKIADVKWLKLEENGSSATLHNVSVPGFKTNRNSAGSPLFFAFHLGLKFEDGEKTMQVYSESCFFGSHCQMTKLEGYLLWSTHFQVQNPSDGPKSKCHPEVSWSDFYPALHNFYQKQTDLPLMPTNEECLQDVFCKTGPNESKMVSQNFILEHKAKNDRKRKNRQDDETDQLQTAFTVWEWFMGTINTFKFFPNVFKKRLIFGYMTKSCAHKKLDGMPVGTCLIRFSHANLHTKTKPEAMLSVVAKICDKKGVERVSHGSVYGPNFPGGENGTLSQEESFGAWVRDMVLELNYLVPVQTMRIMGKKVPLQESFHGFMTDYRKKKSRKGYVPMKSLDMLAASRNSQEMVNVEIPEDRQDPLNALITAVLKFSNLDLSNGDCAIIKQKGSGTGYQLMLQKSLPDFRENKARRKEGLDSIPETVKLVAGMSDTNAPDMTEREVMDTITFGDDTRNGSDLQKNYISPVDCSVFKGVQDVSSNNTAQQNQCSQSGSGGEQNLHRLGGNQNRRGPEGVQHHRGSEGVQNLHCSEEVQNLHCSEEVQNLHRSEGVQNRCGSEGVQNLHYSEEVQNLHRSEEVQNLRRSEGIQSLHHSKEQENSPTSRHCDFSPGTQTLGQSGSPESCRSSLMASSPYSPTSPGSLPPYSVPSSVPLQTTEIDEFPLQHDVDYNKSCEENDFALPEEVENYMLCEDPMPQPFT